MKAVYICIITVTKAFLCVNLSEYSAILDVIGSRCCYSPEQRGAWSSKFLAQFGPDPTKMNKTDFIRLGSLIGMVKFNFLYKWACPK